MKEGDTIIAVNLVDLAITLFTLGVPFYDPLHPYIYQVLGGRRSIRFHFCVQSDIAGVEQTTDLMKLWPTADHYAPPLSIVAIAKRVIWERRTLLREINQLAPPEMQPLANDLQVVDDLRVAAIAYALGFTRPTNYCVKYTEGSCVREGQGPVFVVGTEAPAWLIPHCANLKALIEMITAGVAFIEAPGNEINPIAIAAATFLNATAWLDHLRTDKPYVQFNTASGKSYWVKEGSERWQEFLSAGYTPS